MNKAALALTALALMGCQGDVERREIADDQSCRKIIADRNDTRPEAYKECRSNLMQYHGQAALAASGSTVVVNH